MPACTVWEWECSEGLTVGRVWRGQACAGVEAVFPAGEMGRVAQKNGCGGTPQKPESPQLAGFLDVAWPSLDGYVQVLVPEGDPYCSILAFIYRCLGLCEWGATHKSTHFFASVAKPSHGCAVYSD
jgi:hypothetical protein